VVPRPYKPRDKAKVESGVLVVERWIMAALRNHADFFPRSATSIKRFGNCGKAQQPCAAKREGNQTSVFRTVDQPALSALPDARFDLSEWAEALR
jgi:hypothetical protein